MNNCDWEETKGLAIERFKGLMAAYSARQI
jgi:hypothetical protein